MIKWRWSLLLIILAVAMMQIQGRSLKTSSSPRGIIDLEFAHTSDRLNEILSQLNLFDVRLNIGLDFLFIPAYTFFFLCSITVLSNKFGEGPIQNTAKYAGFAVYLAAMLDIVENILMLLSISGYDNELSLSATTLIAGAKFSLVGLVALYLLTGILWRKSLK